MYHRIRITVVSLVVMAIVMLSSVGTLSYFTDTKSTTNNFVVGNASTELAIYSDTSGNEFSVSAVGPLTDNMPDIAYYLQATNNGNISVYQRFRVVIPSELASAITLVVPCELYADANNENISVCSDVNYSVTYNPSVAAEGATYAEYYIVSNVELAKDGKTAEWPTSAIKIGKISDVADWEQIATCTDDDANNCTFGIRAYSDAIQTAGFSGAVSAFESLTETY